MTHSGTLFICPTPIGNLEDITLRVLRVLKEADLIACEDTRITQKLLNHYQIKTKTYSYHKFSEREKSRRLVKMLLDGKNIALVSDAGTPLISDPGNELLREALTHNIKVFPLPGASSLTTALSASILNNVNNDGAEFVFLGFLPKSAKDKEKLFLKFQKTNIVAFESPNRLIHSLREIFSALGDRNASIARELTKIYEEIRRDKISALIEHYSQNPPKGEIVLIVESEEKASKKDNILDEIEITQKIKLLKKEGYSTGEISRLLSLLFGYPKKEVYKLAIQAFQENFQED